MRVKSVPPNVIAPKIVTSTGAIQLKPGEETLNGILERILFLNEENHFCIGEFRVGEERQTVTIAGALPGVQCGETLRLAGQWVDHQRFGRQFKIRDFRSTLPATIYGIRKYLGSGLIPGIGKTYADKIVNHFGVETLKIISEDSARMREIPGIGRQRARAIKKAWEEQRSVREVMMFLQTYGVSVAQCLRLVTHYGNDTARILRSDPYLQSAYNVGIVRLQQIRDVGAQFLFGETLCGPHLRVCARRG